MQSSAEVWEMEGAQAFKAGARRIVPAVVVVGDDPRVGHGNGIKAAKAWYRGYDRANVAQVVS